jgi:putative SOS response-associated peptidase YedK
MCGRFAQTKELSILINRFNFIVEEFQTRERYNIAPGQYASVVVFENGSRRLKMMKWGLIPFWAKDASIGNNLINAKAETISEKPSFRHAIKRRRCLVIADGFYEWQKIQKRKIPWFFTLKENEIFAFAGLWDEWVSPDDSPIQTFTIITTEANELVKKVHNRMPVMLSPESESTWLSPDIQKAKEIAPLLKSFPKEKMKSWTVSDIVNSTKNDEKKCIEKHEYIIQEDLFSF